MEYRTFVQQLTPPRAVFADVVNIVTVVVFDLLVLYFFGVKSLIYLAAGNIFGGGLHPMAGHLIAEHYTFVKVRPPHPPCITNTHPLSCTYQIHMEIIFYRTFIN